MSATDVQRNPVPWVWRMARAMERTIARIRHLSRTYPNLSFPLSEWERGYDGFGDCMLHMQQVLRSLATDIVGATGENKADMWREMQAFGALEQIATGFHLVVLSARGHEVTPAMVNTCIANAEKRCDLICKPLHFAER